MEILRKVKDKKLTPEKAFERLYGPPPRKARFLLLRLKIKDEKLLSFFINLLFLFPFPFVFLKPIARLILKEEGLDPDLYDQLLKAGKGTEIRVKTNDAKILLKIF
ncbi:MAG: hypothetical protein WBK54_05410 [Bacilli bacterium]|jgi:hypothetical protein|nr:hypothetical protein [Acholeplasmataceae bacterium]